MSGAALVQKREPSPEDRISGALAEAETYALRGLVSDSELAIEKARTCAQENGVTLSKNQEAAIAEMFTTARQNGIDLALAKAAADARRGFFGDCSDEISDARRYAAEAGLALTSEQEIAIEILAERTEAAIGGLGVATKNHNLQ